MRLADLQAVATLHHEAVRRSLGWVGTIEVVRRGRWHVLLPGVGVGTRGAGYGLVVVAGVQRGKARWLGATLAEAAEELERIIEEGSDVVLQTDAGV